MSKLTFENLLSNVTDFYVPKRFADEAKPTDIEFETVGDPVSKSLSKAPEKFKSSKFSSSKALPKILNINCHIYHSEIVLTLKQMIINITEGSVYPII